MLNFETNSMRPVPGSETQISEQTHLNLFNWCSNSALVCILMDALGLAGEPEEQLEGVWASPEVRASPEVWGSPEVLAAMEKSMQHACVLPCSLLHLCMHMICIGNWFPCNPLETCTICFPYAVCDCIAAAPLWNCTTLHAEPIARHVAHDS